MASKILRILCILKHNNNVFEFKEPHYSLRNAILFPAFQSISTLAPKTSKLLRPMKSEISSPRINLRKK